MGQSIKQMRDQYTYLSTTLAALTQSNYDNQFRVSEVRAQMKNKLIDETTGTAICTALRFQYALDDARASNLAVETTRLLRAINASVEELNMCNKFVITMRANLASGALYDTYVTNGSLVSDYANATKQTALTALQVLENRITELQAVN